MNTMKEPATPRETVHGSTNSECHHLYELSSTQGQNGIEREHTNTRNIGKYQAFYISQHRINFPCITRLEQSTTLLTHISVPTGKGPATQGHSTPHNAAQLRRRTEGPPHNYRTTHLTNTSPHIALLL